MKMWIAKDKCTGCGACENICPKNAITMKRDECGFIYPEINDKDCVNCGMECGHFFGLNGPLKVFL